MNPPKMHPRFEEVLTAIERLEQTGISHNRNGERLGLTIAGEMLTKDGSRIPIRMRDVSHSGMGFFHYGPSALEEVTVDLAVNSYRVAIKWCVQCQDDLYISGGPILSTQPRKKATESQAEVHKKRRKYAAST